MPVDTDDLRAAIPSLLPDNLSGQIDAARMRAIQRFVADVIDEAIGKTYSDQAAESADIAVAAAEVLATFADRLQLSWVGNGTSGPYPLSVDPGLVPRLEISWSGVEQTYDETGARGYRIVTDVLAASGKGLQFWKPVPVGDYIDGWFTRPTNVAPSDDTPVYRFTSRADAATWAQANTAPVGTQLVADGLTWVCTGASPIADMPGFEPFGTALVDHFQKNTIPGITDMRPGIVAGMAYMTGTRQPIRGKGVWVPYAVSAGFSVPTETGYADMTIVPLAIGFTNTSILASRLDSASCISNFSGLLGGLFTPKEHQILQNVRFVSNLPSGRVINAVAARNIKNPKFSDLYFTGRMFKCIAAGAWLGDWAMRNVLAENIENEVVFPSMSISSAQITVFELDNEGVTGVDNSTPGTVDNIEGRTLGNVGAALEAVGRQSDVVNIHKGGWHRITNIRAFETDEAVDLFCSNCTGGGFIGEKCSGATLKLTHGASYNKFHGVDTRDGGYWGIVLAASSQRGDVTGNQITGVTVKGVNYGNLLSSSSTSCLTFDEAGDYRCHGNYVSGCDLDPGPDGGYAVLAKTGSGPNFVEVVRALSGQNGAIGGGGVANVTFAGNPPRSVLATMTADQTVATNATTQIEFDTATTDTRFEFLERFNRWIAGAAGTYTFGVSLELSSATSTTLRWRVNGSTVNSDVLASGTGTRTGSYTARLAAGDYVEAFLTASASNAAVITAAGSTFTVADAPDERKGTLTASGNGSTTTFTVTHGLGTTPTFVHLTPQSDAAAAPAWPTTFTETTFTITFRTAPASGTNNVVFNWTASF